MNQADSNSTANLESNEYLDQISISHSIQEQT